MSILESDGLVPYLKKHGSYLEDTL